MSAARRRRRLAVFGSAAVLSLAAACGDDTGTVPAAERAAGVETQGAADRLDAIEPEPGGAPVTRSGAVRAGQPASIPVDVASAGGGERLYARLETSDGSASVRVLDPSGRSLGVSDDDLEVALDEAGTYVVLVETDEGATFELEVGISVPAG